MRIVFTLYAINSAGICFALTVGLMIWDEVSDGFDRFLSYIVEYMFIVFGPVLIVLCSIGLAQISGISNGCGYDKIVT